MEEYPKHGHAFHSLTRRVVLDWLWREEPAFYWAVSVNAADYHGRDFEQGEDADWDDVIEYVYHLLVIGEEGGIDLVDALLDGLSETGSAGLAHALVAAAEEHMQAGRLSAAGRSTVRLWRASVAAQTERYDDALAIARELLALDDEAAPATDDLSIRRRRRGSPGREATRGRKRTLYSASDPRIPTRSITTRQRSATPGRSGSPAVSATRCCRRRPWKASRRWRGCAGTATSPPITGASRVNCCARRGTETGPAAIPQLT